MVRCNLDKSFRAHACVGVDGCRAGWIAVQYEHEEWQFAVFKRFKELLDVTPISSRVLIDIPIGLPWSDVPQRPCDVAARRLLGVRAPSVFSPPTRAAVLADSIAVARSLNIAEVGRSISAQAWGIAPKIAEIDALLLSSADVRHRVREVHPELCFWRLNGDAPMAFAKKTAEGHRERAALLEQFAPGVVELLAKVRVDYRRTAVADDDVLDAAAACITGLGGAEEAIGSAMLDAEGLPMQMLIRPR